MRRHAAAEFQSRQRRCAEAARHGAVHHRHCRVDGWHQPQNTKQAEPRRAETLSVQRKHGYGEEDGGHNGPGTDIAADAEPPAQASRPRTGRRPEADGRLECAASAGEKVVAGISAAICLDADRRACRLFCCLDGGAGDVEFRAVGAPRQFLDGAAIEIARREIHVAKRAAGGEHFVHQADALEQLGPIDVGNHAHAGDDVAHRDNAGALPLMLARAPPYLPSILARRDAGRARSAQG